MRKNFCTSPSLLFAIILSLSSCNCNQNEREITRWERQASKVTITRDNYGIPHIYGKTDALAVFGLMYAQCEDDFNRIENNYINSMGRMAEVEGESMIYTDLRMRLFIDPEKIREEYRKSPLWLKKLMNAWADGINYFLFKHPEVKPRLINRFEPWMALTFSEGSIGGDIEKIQINGLRMFYDKNNLALNNGNDGDNADDTDTYGSNGFAIAPAKSESGNGLLLINPHTSFFFRSEVHMRSDEGLNAYGAVTWGQFFIYQGFNEHCGWMHTSSSADVIDYYLERVEEKNSRFVYLYGEERRPFEERLISISYKDGDSLSKKDIKVYYSHHGPVIREEDGKWVTIRLMVEHEKALTQSYLRTKAKGYDEFYSTMELRTNSSNNTVYADRYGIAYFHGNFMPVRDERFDWSKPVDGSDPATEWKGLHSINDLILIRNPVNGWIQNCNSTPFTACGSASPDKNDYPSYMAPDSENPRGINAVRILERSKKLTPETLLDAAYDNYLVAFENLLPPLVRAYDSISEGNIKVKKSLSRQIEMLRNWDLRCSAGSVATSLAIFYGQEWMDLSSRTGKQSFVNRAGRNTDDSLRISALSAAVRKLETDFGTWETPWGEINRYQRLTGDIVQQFNDEKPSLPVPFASSRWGSLASFTARTYPGTKRMYGTHGNSFVAAVEFGEKIKAYSILAGGISGNPASHHFDDQAVMYTRQEFRNVLFYKEDIEKNTECSYYPGKE